MLCRLLWLRQPGENKGVSSSYGSLILLSLLAHVLPTMGSAISADNVNSKTIAITSKVSTTDGVGSFLAARSHRFPSSSEVSTNLTDFLLLK